MKFLIPRLFMLLAVLPLAASATAEMKIAVIDFQKALMMTDAAKAVRDKIQKEVKIDQGKAQSLQSELKELNDKLQKDGAIMSADEKKKLNGQFQEKKSELQFYAGKMQKTAQKMEQEFLMEHGPAAEKVAQELIKEKGYDMVLNRNAVAHALPEHDLTKELLDKLNKALK